MTYQLNTSIQDIKRLKGPQSDFIIICNTTNKILIQQFISEHLSKSNPSHHVVLISSEIIKAESTDSKNISSTINKLITKDIDPQKPQIYIIQINQRSIKKIKDWTSILIQHKIESGLIKKIYKEHFPVMLCKFIPEKKDYFEHLKSAILVSKKSGSNFSVANPMFTFRVSHIILSEDIKDFKNATESKKYLISRLSVLGQAQTEKSIIRFNTFLKNKNYQQELIQEISVDKIDQEIKKMSASNKLLSFKQFDIYIAPFSQMPNTMLEIGRLRELTFRKVKEGTGLALDLDSFDPYYLHLFIWDSKSRKIAGAYRLVEGHKIIPLLGKKGFYISTLFKLKDEFTKTLIQSVELGRSFIAPEYQKSNLLLLLMWKALYSYIFSQPENRYILGPVSISEEYSKISRLLIMDYLKKYYGHSALHKMVKPRKPFRLIRNNASEKIILRNFEKDIHKLDKLISEIQYNAFKLPVLLRQYLKQNAKVIAFNKDPRFQNVLDALLILDHENMSGEFADLLQKELK